MFRSLLASLLFGFVQTTTTPSVKSIAASVLFPISPPTSIEQPLVIDTISASGAILLDVRSGEVLFSKAPDDIHPIASLTKLMTAMVVLDEWKNLQSFATIPTIAEEIGGSTIDFPPGQHLTIEDLLKSLLVASANDAAYTLALCGGERLINFIEKMNERSHVLGLKKTHFTNPAGLDNPEHYSTPREVAWMALAAWRKPILRSFLASPRVVVQSKEGERITLRNTNELLHTDPRILGGKTGTTNKAGECLVLFFTEGGKEYLIILLGSSSRYTDASRIMDAIATKSE